MRYANYLKETMRISKAITVADNLEEEQVTDLNIKLFLLGCYEATKQWEKMANTYDSCFIIAPQLRGREKVAKQYKKVCKKAGREVA